jgi:hypothetical protein
MDSSRKRSPLSPPSPLPLCLYFFPSLLLLHTQNLSILGHKGIGQPQSNKTGMDLLKGGLRGKSKRRDDMVVGHGLLEKTGPPLSSPSSSLFPSLFSPSSSPYIPKTFPFFEKTGPPPSPLLLPPSFPLFFPLPPPLTYPKPFHSSSRTHLPISK